MRGLAQRCPGPRIHSLVSIGGPQQGVYGLPKCLGEDHTLCDYARRLLNYGAYIGWIQRLLVQVITDILCQQQLLWIETDMTLKSEDKCINHKLKGDLNPIDSLVKS